MPYCTSCGQLVGEDAIHCAHCGTTLRIAQRPVGITIIAVLIIIGAVSNLFSVFMGSPTALLGMILTGTAARVFFLVLSGFAFYCGFGLWNMKKLACDVFIGVSVFNIINSLLSVLRLEELWAIQGLQLDDGAAATVPAVLLILSLAIGAFLIIYLIKKRPLFIN